MPLPTSWLHRLRRKRGDSTRGGEANDDATTTTKKKSGTRQPRPMAAAGRAAPPPPCSPNRASYYFPSGERRAATTGNPRLRDTRFPRSPQPSDIVFDVVAVSAARRDDRFDDGAKAMPELKLRPIVTKRAAKKGGGGDDAASDSGTSAPASPTARVRRFHHAKPSAGRRNKPGRVTPALPAGSKQRRRRRCRWLYESLVVVKESADPEEDFLASMAEMITENGVRSPRELEELLGCYLALNAAEHHRAIVGAFRRARLHTTTTPLA